VNVKPAMTPSTSKKKIPWGVDSDRL